MTNSKKHQKWIEDLIKSLESLGLEKTDDRKKKYRIVKGFIEGKPYFQKFSNTPSSYVTAPKSILRETKRKLLNCGIDIDKINNELPMNYFLTLELIKQQEREEKYKSLASIIKEIERDKSFKI